MTTATMHPLLEHSEAAADVLELLGQSAKRMTPREIGAALERNGKLYGHSTLKHALALMVKLGLLHARHAKPYGFKVVSEGGGS